MNPIPFDKLYANVPADQRDRLRDFRRTHPLKQVQASGVDWEYLASGQGAGAILILVGGLRAADAAYPSILRLESDFRVITPTYPALDTMGALADGLADVLDVEGLERAHVLSGSFGGMLALAFVQRHPDRVDRLVLSSTAVPTPSEATTYRRMDRLMGLLPSRLARKFMRDRLYAIIDPPPDERAFWAAYLDELFGWRLDKAAIRSTLRCMVDFAANAPRSPADLPGWSGRTLLITSDDDHTFGPDAQDSLRSVLARIEVHTLHGAGHSPSWTQPEAFFGAVRDFLQ